MEDNNEYGNMLWVDTRNATNDHRTGGGGRPVPFFPGGNRIPAGWNFGSRTPQPMPYQQPQVVYATAPNPLGSALGKISIGQVTEMVTQVIAAFLPLPAQPIVMKDAAIDAGNAIVYNGALAAHAKRDELIRTIGAIAVKVLG